jgi:hypothetical protein
LFNENINALHFLENSGLKIKGSLLYMANLKRLSGIIYNSKLDYKNSVISIKEAKQHFKEIKSVHGLALCNFSIGYIYRSNIVEIGKNVSNERINNVVKIFLTNALRQFQEINHYLGCALSCKWLS